MTTEVTYGTKRYLVTWNSVPPPRPVEMTLTCDADHGLLPQTVAKLDVTTAIPREVARAAGWRFVFRDDREFVICPECSP